MARTSDIKLTVELDDNKLPEKILWEATDSGFEGQLEAKTLMLSLWDKNEEVTLGIDLWTKEMMVNDMSKHFHQMMLKMADTYRRSTKDDEAAKMIEDFASDFLEKVTPEEEKS
ncbi:MAG: gliding motility protein GldC [Ignavibacteriaceae bacterium]|nr:gliding motility protein GldC [Ignavibacteriaceae bacterium]